MPSAWNSRIRWCSVLCSQVLAPVLLLGALACSSDSTKIEVVVDPVMVTVAPGETVQLQATVTGTRDTRLQWTVSSGGGTVDDSGLYTAPPEEGSALVRATSMVSPESFAHVQVMVKKGPPVLSLTLLPASRKLGVQEYARFEVQISNGTGTEQLEWRVDEGSQGGTVMDLGQGAADYRAPATPGTFHLSVSIQGKPEVSARATLTVTQEAPQATLHGNVTYAGQKQGRVYVLFVWGVDGGAILQPKLSTSLEAPGAYSLHPLQDSTSPTFVLAFIDTHGTGRINLATDPMALVPLYLTGEDQVLNLTLVDPSQPPPLKELSSAPLAVGLNDGLLVAFGSSYDSVGTWGELADSYKIYWSQQQAPGPSNSLGSRTVSAGQALPEYGHLTAVSGLTPGQYYVGVAPMRGGVEGSVRAMSYAVEVGRTPGAGATLSGQVQLEAPAASGVVYVVAARGANMLITRVPMSAATVSWSIPGLADGDYTVWALLDANGDGFPERDTPRIEARPHVTVSGTAPMSAPDLSFAAAPSTARATSLQQSGWLVAGAIQAEGIFYHFSFPSGSKQPVAVRLSGGQGLPTPYDVPCSISAPFYGSLAGLATARFGFEWAVANQSSALPVGAHFTAEVRNADGSTEQLPVDAPPVLPVAGLTAPVGSASTSSTPAFVWSLPTGLPASLTQRLMVRADTSFGAVMWSRLLPLSQSQVTYNDDGKAVALSSGAYYWEVELSDGQGNIGRASDFFQLQ